MYIGYGFSGVRLKLMRVEVERVFAVATSHVKLGKASQTLCKTLVRVYFLWFQRRISRSSFRSVEPPFFRVAATARLFRRDYVFVVVPMRYVVL